AGAYIIGPRYCLAHRIVDFEDAAPVPETLHQMATARWQAWARHLDELAYRDIEQGGSCRREVFQAPYMPSCLDLAPDCAEAGRLEAAEVRRGPLVGRAPRPFGSEPRPAITPAVGPATQSEPAGWDVSASERLARENHRPLHLMIAPAGRCGAGTTHHPPPV